MESISHTLPPISLSCRVAAEDRGAGVDDHVVLHVRVALVSLHQHARLLVLREGERAERDALVEFHVASDHGGLADHDARAVVNEEMLADRRAGMDVDARLRVGVFAHDARDDRHLQLVELVGEAVHRGDGVEAGIGHHHLHAARRGGITLVGGCDVGLQQAAHLGNARAERGDDGRRVGVRHEERDLFLERGVEGVGVARLAAAHRPVQARMERGEGALEEKLDSFGQGHGDSISKKTAVRPRGRTAFPATGIGLTWPALPSSGPRRRASPLSS